MDGVHEAGGKIYAQVRHIGSLYTVGILYVMSQPILQLWHLGRVSHPDAPEQKLAGTVSTRLLLYVYQR